MTCKPAARLVALEPRRRVEFGRLKGQIWISDDFDAIDQDLIDSFEGNPPRDDASASHTRGAVGRHRQRSCRSRDPPTSAGSGNRQSVEIERSGIAFVDIDGDDAIAAGALPRHHGDPFDRMIVAQAIRRDAWLVTADSALSAYEVRTVRADG